MGDLSSPDCSWKKMVIAKANDEWISTIKTEQSEVDSVNSTTFSLNNPVSYNNIKKEYVSNDSTMETTEDTMLQEVDPLLVIVEPRRRRKGSGPRNETPEERQSRLAKMSAYAAQRLAKESPEQRALRLKRMSEYAAKRLAQETNEQRAKRLSRMSAYAAKRLSEETQEQRQARLSRMSAYAARRRNVVDKKRSAKHLEDQSERNLLNNLALNKKS